MMEEKDECHHPNSTADTSRDIHTSSPEQSRLIHAGPDATIPPETATQMEEEDAAAESANVTLLLPRVFLIRHGESLFNAMSNAHSMYRRTIPEKGQRTLNFGGGSASSSHAQIVEGALIGGLPLIMDVDPYNDARLIDAPLTELGQQQAREAHQKVKKLGIDLVLSTPLTRAIQTSLLVFRPKANSIDWDLSMAPSINQPITNVSIDKPIQPIPTQLTHPPIRVIPYHVENLCASCDVGIPLSILASRFSSEPNLDFETAREMMSDCWWSGSAAGSNTSHLIIKRAPVSTKSSASSSPVGTPTNSARATSSTSSAPSTAATNTSSSHATFQPLYDTLSYLGKMVTQTGSKSESKTNTTISKPIPTTITLKTTDKLPTGINIQREQSTQIESRTKKLLQYLLELSVEHSQSSEHGHRAMNIALVGHCGFFARLSGHNLANCEMVELDWSHVLKRAALKGFLTLPKGMKHSDVGDVRKQSTIVRHWLDDLTEGIGRRGSQTSATGKISSIATGYSASHPPHSSNTAQLVPPKTKF